MLHPAVGPCLDIASQLVDSYPAIFGLAPGATAVEISGDFTDWRPVPLRRNPASADAWVASFRISKGLHRINVRRDGGPWMAPGGTTRSADDYDGEVGVFVLP